MCTSNENNPKQGSLHNCVIAEQQIAELEAEVSDLRHRLRAGEKTFEWLRKQVDDLRECVADAEMALWGPGETDADEAQPDFPVGTRVIFDGLTGTVVPPVQPGIAIYVLLDGDDHFSRLDPRALRIIGEGEAS